MPARSGDSGKTPFVAAAAVARSVLGPELTAVLQVVTPLHGGIWSLTEFEGASEGDLAAWESKHGVALPQDLRELLAATDGVTARWALRVGDRLEDVGLAAVNPVKKLVRVPEAVLARTRPDPQAPKALAAAFCLSRVGSLGTTALAFLQGTPPPPPQVWFLDLGGDWHFVAETFSDYLRVLFAHVGVRGWEYAFTPAGLDPEAKQWLRLLAPQRLRVDELRAEFAREPHTVALGNQRQHQQQRASGPRVRLAHLEDPDREGETNSAGANVGEEPAVAVTRAKKRRPATARRAGAGSRRGTRAKAAGG